MSDISPEQELIEQLRSDKRSLRIQAAVKLTRCGRTKEALDALSILVSHGDREESFFASQAITKISQKLGITSSLPNISPSNNTNNESINTDFDFEKLTSFDFLSASKEKAATLLKYVREHSSKLSEDILPSVGVFLGKFGNVDDSEFILNYLKTHHNTLTLPFISAAEKIDSKILIPVLPYLLASKEPLVRSKAVMVLRKIDPEEAERHFLNLLSSKQAENRLAALEISFLFPFDRVKNYIIALLSEEKDADVFKTCATALASNPSLEIALKLLDVLEATPPEQRKPITSIFNIVSIAIRSAKILSEKESSPQALVSVWKHQRLKKFLDDLEIQLCIATSQKKEAIINWIKKNINVPEVAKFLEKLALNPQTENIYLRITNPKSKKTTDLTETKSTSDLSSTSESITSNDEPDNNQDSYNQNDNIQSDSKELNSDQQENDEELNSDLTKLSDVNDSDSPSHEQEYSDSDKEQVSYLKQLDTQQFLMEKQRIIDLADNSNTSIPLRAEALNTLLRLSPSIKLKSMGLKALNDDNVKIKTAGFKILERVAPDVLKEKLPDLLHSNETAIRVRAIRVGLKTDQEKSIQSLQKLISSEDQILRSYAISCLALCPIESVYNILIRTLQSEPYPLVAKQICCVLVSNPDPLILSILDKLIIITKDPDRAMIISQARNELEDILASMPERFKNSKLADIDIFQNSKEEEKPYSVENVRKLTNTSFQAKKDDKSSGKEKTGFFQGLSGISIFLIVATIVFIPFMIYAVYDFLNNKSFAQYKNRKGRVKNERSINTDRRGGIQSTIRLNKNCTISGKITNVLPSEDRIIMKYNGRELMIKFKKLDVKKFKVGDTVSVTCIPTRENPQGIIICEGSKISLMK